MAQKTVTVFIIDALGASELSDGGEVVKETLHFLLHDILLAGRKGDHVAFLLANTRLTDHPLATTEDEEEENASGSYRHISVFHPITSQPSHAMLTSLLELDVTSVAMTSTERRIDRTMHLLFLFIKRLSIFTHKDWVCDA